MPSEGEKMLVNKMILENLYQDAGERRTQRAKKYQEDGRAKIIDVDYKDNQNFEIRGMVAGTKPYRTFIAVKDGEIEDITCTCEDYYQHYSVCKHTLATVLEFNQNKSYSEKYGEDLEENFLQPKAKLENYRSFQQIVNIFYNEAVEGMDEEESNTKKTGTIKIEPQIFYDKFLGDMKIEFKIGNKRMYKIKNLSEFYTRMINQEFYRYGEKLQFIHTEEAFEEESKKLLNFIMKYAEIIKYANSNSNSNYKYYGKALSETSIIVGNSAIDDLFEVLEGRKVEFQKDYHFGKIEFTKEQPKIEFKLKKTDEQHYVIEPNIEIYKVNIIKGKKYKYILDEEKLYRCTKEFENSNLKLLELFRQNYMTEVKLGKNELTQLFSVIVPKVKNAITIENIPQEEIEKYKPKELMVKVFLDFDKKDYLIADVKFCYEDQEFNPLDEKIKLEIPRNMIKETRALNTFRKTGFMLDVKNLRFILPDNDKIYEFLTQDIGYYMQQFEVLVTDNFKAKQMKQPKMGTLGVKVENDLLSIDLKGMNIDQEELKDIMEKYSLKKKYHRLKDGSFIDLENNKEIEFLDKLVTGMDIDYEDLENGEVKLPVYRSLYLNQLLKGMKGTEIEKNAEYKTIVNQLDKEQLEEDIKVPEQLNSILRYYQKTGFKWLKILDRYHFGGILADDMGLRKNNTNVIYYCRLRTKRWTRRDDTRARANQ